MLQQWATSGPTPKASSPHIETPEQRENRLLRKYESALNETSENARNKLTDIATSLSQSRELRLGKRPRPSTPLWERRLRYAVHRNLADVSARLGDSYHALQSYTHALDDDNTDFLIWLKAARTAAETGQLHIARKAYEVALSMRPRHWLVLPEYQAILCAIFDSDEDVAKSNLGTLSSKVSVFLTNRRKHMHCENETSSPPVAERITINELSWACLVDALMSCLEQRLSSAGKGGAYDVAFPILFEIDNRLQPSVVQSGTEQDGIISKTFSSDQNEVVDLVSSSRDSDGSKSAIDTNEVSNQAMENNQQRIPTSCTSNMAPDSKENCSKPGESPLPPGNGVAEVAQDNNETPSNTKNVPLHKTPIKSEIVQDSTIEQPKKLELRRSSRSRPQQENQSDKRRLTRTATEAKDSTQMDTDLINTLLAICHDRMNEENREGTKDTLLESGTRQAMPIDSIPNPSARRHQCLWNTVIDERTEAKNVSVFICSFPERNSGPADLMLRTLRRLSEIQVAQYSSTLAVLWSTLRSKMQFCLPGSITTTALIVEAMLCSGKKAGKAKEYRFNEAHRLLSQLYIDYDIEKESGYLKLRLTWSWTNLYECCGKMQKAFDSANHALHLLTTLQGPGHQERIPGAAGPELSGHSSESLRNLIKERLARLKRAGDLEKAEVELSKVAKGDREAAIRTVSILAPSVNASIRALEFDQWDENDQAVEFHSAAEHGKWEERLDAEVELEPRLKVFSEACTKATDLVGELLCFSVRLRMAVHFYASQLRVETKEKEKPLDKSSSCEVRLADLLILIRKYALVIKKIASPSSADLWNRKEGISGWSMEKATTVAEITLISLTKLLIAKIPILKFSTPVTELRATQKNKRLGFTRCMLAFVRCYLVNQNCRMSAACRSEGPESSRTRSLTLKRLFTTSYCLRALVDRGCCREEGTSGALMKLYSQFLANRLRQLALMSHLVTQREEPQGEQNCIAISGHELESVKQKDGAVNVECGDRIAREEERCTESNDIRSQEATPEKARGREGEEEMDRGEGQPRLLGADGASPEKNHNDHNEQEEYDSTPISQIDATYAWKNVTVIRRELSQCYQCLYQIPGLELVGPYSQGGPIDLWLEEGCRVSKHIGLQFTSGEPMNVMPAIDIEACCNVYFFYRKRIFEAIGPRRRDGGRGKKLREILSRLAESLPETPPSTVHLLPFEALNEIVMDVISSKGDISRGAAENVTRLEEEWNRGSHSNSCTKNSERAQDAQLSILYFEVFSLHALSTMWTHEQEYKKQKSAERRKSPKEVAERLISAYSDCLVALRSRPWSVGAWILLGRIFVETADLALDERELSLSSFGLYRPGDLATFDEKISSIHAIFGRAEASFAFAESLLKHPWTERASKQLIPIDSALVLGQAFQDDEVWNGFGDDGDLFGWFGLTNSTTCRPQMLCERHPVDKPAINDSLRLAAIRFGCSALSILRLREQRYFHTHWTHSTLEIKLLTHPRNRFPEHIVRLSSIALSQLREARMLCGMDKQPEGEHHQNCSVDTHAPIEGVKSTVVREDCDPLRPVKADCAGQLRRNFWYYLFLEAKLMRKEGQPAKDYLPVLQRALEENKRLRDSLRQPPDIEPIYKLHSARMKILRATEDNVSAIDNLALLEKYSYNCQQRPIVVEDDRRRDDDDWIIERKIAIAEDIILAMQYCANPKSEMVYSEFFFKSTFCKVTLLVEVLKDVKSAIQELDRLFGTDSALRALDQGPDGVYRGYFYRMWNYRYTDTGIEPALESERKLVRWRGKMLGLYGQLLKNVGEWRLLAAIISRLKKRNSEDLPVDGALLDDLIEAYAVTSRSSILTAMEKSIITDPSAFESSYRRTWDIYAESLRIAQGVKRVAISVNRGEMNETGGERLISSGRPKCLAAIHTALRLEHVRWKSAIENKPIDMNFMKTLPVTGALSETSMLVRQGFVEALQESARKWPLEDKIAKLLVRRITDLSAMESPAPQNHEA